jgi:hypothetical protein
VNNVNQQVGNSSRIRQLLAFARKPSLLLVLLLLAIWCVGPTANTQDSPRGVLRLRVKVKANEAAKALTGLSRKRFFLIKGSLEQNKTLIEAMDRQPLTTRDCYYTRAGASPSLLSWLKDNDCESVYCRELVAEDVEGPRAVSEFASALTAGEKTFGSHQLALKWLTVNLPEKVISVMTDRNGTALFTDLEAGAYTLSNVVGAEIGPSVALWNCDVQMKADDLTTEKVFTISNRKDKNVKCVAVEKPLPACTP